MTIFYAVDYDVDLSSTISGVRAFRSMADRDKFVDGGNLRRGITLRGADALCLKTHKCAAHKAHQKGLI
jgi:hypothetical protein